MSTHEGGEINWTRIDGEQMAQKSYAELDGIDLSNISSGRPDQLRTYAEAAAEAGNLELLAALGTAAFMQFRIPQNEGYQTPSDLFTEYQETFDYIRGLIKKPEEGMDEEPSTAVPTELSGSREVRHPLIPWFNARPEDETPLGGPLWGD